MGRVCPSCGTDNAGQLKFCFACGSRFAEPLAARRERKFATALFADLVGSTALTEREDPETVQSVVGRTFDQVSQAIEAYGGFLEKFIGDAVLAVFGVPIVHEDDSERAVRAAVEMRRLLSELNRDFKAEGKPELAMRIGIEAGDVLVDLERVTGVRDRMLTGNAVNTAARLQQVADPGGIVVGPQVYAATKGIATYEAIGPLELKGRADVVRPWQLLRVTSHRGGERAPLGLEAKLVGRDEELALLRQMFSRAKSEHRPSLITVLGPAGVGKSRLAREMHQYLEELPEDLCWRRGRCLPYGNVSYSALAEAVKSHCQILEDDAPEVIEKKIAETVEELFGTRALHPHLEALVGSGRAHTFPREDLFDAWRRFLEQIAVRSPLVLVLEDIHWADEGLLDFIDHVADWAQGSILILTLARPELLERRPTWGGGKRSYAAVYLDPLTNDETLTLLQGLLSTTVPDELARIVVGRSEGNPLFAEEIVRMLIDRGAIRETQSTRWEVTGAVNESEVPRSIQTLIAARLDSLPKEEKSVLQDASVVGPTFWLGTVTQLYGGTMSEVRAALGRLRIKEIVMSRDSPAFSGEVEFFFRHALIRDAAYDSLPKALRADKHVQVARWAQNQAGERRDEIAELLATHYLEALHYLRDLGERGDRRKRVEAELYPWAKAAAHRARRLWQQREAVRWWRVALDVADGAEVSKNELAELWESYARASERVNPYPDVIEAFEEALGLYEELAAQADVGRVEAWLANVLLDSGHSRDEAIPRAERALARLEPLGDSADLAFSLLILGWCQDWPEARERAEDLFQRARDMAKRVGDLVTQGGAMLASALFVEGEEAVCRFEEVLHLARQAGDLSLLLRTYVYLMTAYEEISGDYRQAEALLREGLDIARKASSVGDAAWMEGNLADVLVELGRLDEAEKGARRGLEAARAVGELPRIGYSLCTVAALNALRGELAESQRVLEELREVQAQYPDPYFDGWVTLVSGLVARGRGSKDAARDIFVQGARRLGDRIEVWGGQSLLLECVRSLVQAGQLSEAVSFRNQLERLARKSVPARTFLKWADGLLEPDPETARDLLLAAAAEFDDFGRQIEAGRCLADVGTVEHRMGLDATQTVGRAREVLDSCGAVLFLDDVAVPSTPSS